MAARRRRDVHDAGDLLWVELDPALGHEQAGRRPALVISDRSYNRVANLIVVCPITSNIRPWPFKVLLPPGLAIGGAILADQAKSIDPRPRAIRRAGAVPAAVLAEVRARLAAVIGLRF